MLAGVELEDGFAQVDRFRVVDSVPGQALVELVLHEGRKHIVRRLLAECGYPVSRLIRTAIGPVRLGDVKPGRTRKKKVEAAAAEPLAVDRAEPPAEQPPEEPPTRPRRARTRKAAEPVVPPPTEPEPA